MSAALTTNVDMRLLRATKFPPEFNVKVDMTKVNTAIIKKWVTDELAKILQNEDDVVTELVSNMIEETRYPNIKELQISLTGFLDKDAAPFCTALWKLCLSAQDSPQGIPKELLQAKAQEIRQQREEDEKAREEAIKRQEAEREREREIARIRERERNERNERSRGRGGRNGRDYDRRPPLDSRSPPPRRRRDDDDYRRAPPSRGTDTYIPSSSGRRDSRPPRRRRSPSYHRPPSRSRSPPRKRRNVSPERSRSRHRDGNRRDRRPRDDDRRGSRSPPRRRRSPSPRRHRRRASSSAERKRSPPSKRAPQQHRDQPSTSDSRSSGRSPSLPTRAKKKASLATEDLMAAKGRQDLDRNRLSRSVSEEDEKLFSFLGAATRAQSAQQSSLDQRQSAGQPCEKLLKQKLLAQLRPLREANLQRKDGVISKE